MSQQIPSAPHDLELWLVENVPAHATAGRVVNQLPELVAPYQCIVVGADLQNRATPISRYARVRVQGRAVRADGTGDLEASFGLARYVGVWLEANATSGPLIHAEIDAGPYRVTDSTSKVEYSYLTVLLEVSA